MQIGARLGAYEVIAKLGEGGMGEVYRARDAKLHRDVALKVLPDLFALDADRLTRFTREAHVLASLNHPHIAGIYGLEESDGIRALVLELVDGPTLADRIAQGPVPLDEALPIARQIVDALEAAHELGIVHRDLKPANIKVRDDGTVKVLDFGLAKALSPEVASTAGAAVSLSPTITSPAATRLGVILGTAAYMAPEQARGKTVDRRADIWAFGCVLYEMLTGKRAFGGEDMSDTLAAVLRAEVDWSALPASVPGRLRRVLQACLQRDPKQRVQAIGDVRLALDGAFETSTTAAVPAETARTFSKRNLLIALSGAVVCSTIAGLLVWAFVGPTQRPQPPMRFAVRLADDQTLTGAGRHLTAISPQGTHLVYGANNGLWLRPLGALEATAIPGTDGARSPFFSPDGQWIGFYQAGQLKRVLVSGGAPIAIGPAANPFGASWGMDDVIVYGQGARGLWRMPSSGGTPEPLVAVEPGEQAHGPQLLPDGDWVLYTLMPAGVATWDQAQIVVQSRTSRERSVVIAGGRDARYLPTGHLVYALNQSLLAARFDASTRRITGAPVTLVEEVADAANLTGTAHFSIAGTGTLVYVPSGNVSIERTLVWVDRSGREEPLGVPPRWYGIPRLSPDGTRIAVDIRDQQLDIWTWDLGRRTLSRLTFDPESDLGPAWFRDGRHIAYAGERAGRYHIYRVAADGSGAPERVFDDPAAEFPESFAADGTRLLVSTDLPVDVGVISMESPSRLQMLLNGSHNERNAEVSPDGRWLAYESDESGQSEVYVRPFPDVKTGRWQVSNGGGTRPVWAGNGRELFYFVPPGRLMAATIQPGSTFSAASPRLLFEGQYYYTITHRMYDVAPDGNRFLMIKAAPTAEGDKPSQQLVVVLNWTEELKRLVPTR
jgi:serine/threonine-protein kinase